MMSADQLRATKKTLLVRNGTSVVPLVPQHAPPLVLPLAALAQPPQPLHTELQLLDTELLDTELLDTEPLGTEPLDMEARDTEPLDMEVRDMEPLDMVLPVDAVAVDVAALVDTVDMVDTAVVLVELVVPVVLDTQCKLPLPPHLLLLPLFQAHQEFPESQE